MDEPAEDAVPSPPNVGENPPPDWILDIVKWVATDPWDFVTTVFLFLSPLFLISAVLAYKLSKQIEAREKEKKRTARRDKNLKHIRRAKID